MKTKFRSQALLTLAALLALNAIGLVYFNARGNVQRDQDQEKMQTPSDQEIASNAQEMFGITGRPGGEGQSGPLISTMFALAIEFFAFAAVAPRFYWIASIMIALTITIVVARFGLLATIAAQVFFFLSMEYPITTDLSAWYVSSTLFAIAIILGLAVYGFYTSLGGQPVFAGRLLSDE